MDFSKNKIKIEKAKNFFKKLPKLLAKHPFSTFFGLLAVDLILGGFVFYKYVFLIEKLETQTPGNIFKFDETTYQEVLNQWQQREEILKNIDNKIYPNPFQGPGEGIVSPTSTEPATSTPEATSTPPEPPEKPVLPSNIERLLATTNLYEFYIIKDGWIPSVRQRAKVWQEKGLGSEDDYKGTDYQNMILLKKLKEELTK